MPAAAASTPGALARVTETPGCATRMRGYGAPNRRHADASLAPCNQPRSIPGAFGGGMSVPQSWKLLSISRELTVTRSGLELSHQEQDKIGMGAFGGVQEPDSEIWPPGLKQATKRTVPSAQLDLTF